ncbi:MAG: chemotaxis protein CheB [Actinomycetota bacterium]|nr:chemotaxis protein CheB [Actinomycetota bacterium]
MSEPAGSRPPFPVVALVSSTGGLDALRRVLGPLPQGLPAAVIAMQHTDPTHPSGLARLLDRQTTLTVRPAVSGAELVPGEVLVPPAGSHLLVGRDDRVHLIPTGLLPPARPSADLLLSTLAVALGERAIAVVLTGSGHDASLGVQAITLFGGACLMQDEASSVQYGMPGAATASGDYGPPLPLDEIAAVLTRLLTGRAPAA